MRPIKNESKPLFQEGDVIKPYDGLCTYTVLKLVGERCGLSTCDREKCLSGGHLALLHCHELDTKIYYCIFLRNDQLKWKVIERKGEI